MLHKTNKLRSLLLIFNVAEINCTIPKKKVLIFKIKGSEISIKPHDCRISIHCPESRHFIYINVRASIFLNYPTTLRERERTKMANFLFLCFLSGNLLLYLAMASDEKPQAMLESSSSSSNPPAGAPSLRKLGKHSLSTPSPESEETVDSHSEAVGIPSHERASVEAENNGGVMDSHDGHHSLDKSVAGGGVILGGLATTFLVAVFCYIRATGRHKPETTA